MRIKILSLFICCVICVLLPTLIQAKVVTFNKKSNYDIREKPMKAQVSREKYERKPLVLIPGVLGNQVEAKLNKPSSPTIYCDKKADWYSLWLNLEQLAPFIVDCWVDNMRLIYDNATNSVKNSPGVQTRIPHFGSTESFEYLDKDKYAVGSSYFAPLVEYLVFNLGYTRLKDLFGAPFDWRLAPKQSSEYLKNLTELIEKAYHNNNDEKVVLIAHSMGNLFVYSMLQHQPLSWKEKYVDSFVSISAPYLGSVKAIKALTSGETEGHDWVLPMLKLREVVRTIPSSALMLPRPDLWPKTKQTVVVTFKRNYTVHDYKDLFERIGCQNCWEMWIDNGMSLGSLAAPSVPVHCIYSSQVPTAETLIYDEALFPDESPSLVDGSGDGTVNVWSASACLKWKGEQSQPVKNVELPGNTHVHILWNATLHDYLKGVLVS